VRRYAKKAKTSGKYPGVEWIGGTGAFIAVDKGKCRGCGSCVKVCLGDCWELSGKKAGIKNLDLCMECGSCWYVCPEGAVSFSWPKGGTGFRTSWG
jgi:NAD-dependent dihydropyrimidine dehydrogenase PreA subunit